ncbi:MAG: histidine phosphatase family protein [Methylomonas sp.]|nr:histidine phosphatase family protein [Methylomonas sp.]
MDILRHGHVLGGDYFRGVTDDPLSEHGLRQMFRQCRGGHWQTVISSPLRRCDEFAAAFGKRHRLECVVLADWREIDFGDWEGLSAEQILCRQPLALEGFYADPTEFTPPNAESYDCFANRIRGAWDKLLADFSGQQVLVVTHAGVIRVLFSQLLAIPPRQSFQIDVPHACLTRFSCFDDTEGRFVQLNFHRPI